MSIRRLRTANLSSFSANRVAAKPPHCAPSPGWKPSIPVKILIGGKAVQMTKPEACDVAFVFQNFALYPHLTVYENMTFPLRAVGLLKAEIDETVRRVAGVLQISNQLGRRPSALSGGDLQRAAIGRALVRNPKAMLMDDPSAALTPNCVRKCGWN
ncbi:MAG: ATP-binding cassette domain-containing protein [Cypionkella sp.]